MTLKMSQKPPVIQKIVPKTAFDIYTGEKVPSLFLPDRLYIHSNVPSLFLHGQIIHTLKHPTLF
jgi:hypothetical protein